MSLLLGGASGGGSGGGIDFSSPTYSIPTGGNPFSLASANVRTDPANSDDTTHWIVTIYDPIIAGFRIWDGNTFPPDISFLPALGATQNFYYDPIGNWEILGQQFAAFSNQQLAIDLYAPQFGQPFNISLDYLFTEYGNYDINNFSGIASMPMNISGGPPNIIARVDPNFTGRNTQLQYASSNYVSNMTILDLTSIGYDTNQWSIAGHSTPGVENYQNPPPTNRFTDMLFLVNQSSEIARLVEVDLYNTAVINESADFAFEAAYANDYSWGSDTVVGSNYYDLGNGTEGMTVIAMFNNTSNTIDLFLTKSIHVGLYS